MGQRANFEENYSDDSLQGSYMAGVYYPDKTRVGWWKNGYPEYFAKVLNSTNWIGIDIKINGETLDLAKAAVKNFTRILNMKEAYLERSFNAVLSNGNEVKVNAKRFLSAVYLEIGAIKYSITPVNFSGELIITPYLDGDVKNQDSNYDEKFWDEVQINASTDISSLVLKTKKLDFHICSAMKFDIVNGGVKINSAVTTDIKKNLFLIQ
jgi:maltose phosphorylase